MMELVKNYRKEVFPLKFLVQCKHVNGSIDGGMFTEQQIIDMVAEGEQTGCKYEVFDIRHFGAVKKLLHFTDATKGAGYHKFVEPEYPHTIIFQGVNKTASGFNSAGRKCVNNCPFFAVNNKTKLGRKHFGYCKKFDREIEDTLCGCETINGKTKLVKFKS